MATGSSVLYLYFFHESLASKVHHSSRCGNLPVSISENLTSVPPEIFSEEYYAVYDQASKSVSRQLLPDMEPQILLTRLMRRNMTQFARFPQAWVLKMLSSPEERRSFQALHLANLDFQDGDLACGMYRVKHRTPTRVEFELKPTGIVNGRLVVSLQERGDDVVFTTETVMWRPAKEKVVMPLERGLVKWVHETAAWWLLDSGIRYLTDLKGEL